MKKLKYTKREAIRLHRKMWHELAKNGERSKPEVDAICRCYACQYDSDKGDNSCRHCPLEWPQKEKTWCLQCSQGNGLYAKWATSHSLKRRKALALQIANLPIRKV
jgi:hypothetical protein